MLEFTYVAVSDRGRVRSENQDNLYCNGKHCTDDAVFRTSGVVRANGLFVVADGMGGETNGSLAAMMAVDGLKALQLPVSVDALKAYISCCNTAVCNKIEQNGGARMGTTFAGLTLHDGQAEIINLGDSRVYLFRQDALHCLSKDHTVIRPLLDVGLMTAEQARKHPDRHKLTQHIGIFPDEMILEPHIAKLELLAEDIFVLCSDGLTDALDDAELTMVLQRQDTIQGKLEQLYQAALNGSRDNITIILIEVGE